MTIFVEVVNIFAIFENREFLHSLGRFLSLLSYLYRMNPYV